jgi:hypothetical protein
VVVSLALRPRATRPRPGVDRYDVRRAVRTLVSRRRHSRVADVGVRPARISGLAPEATELWCARHFQPGLSAVGHSVTDSTEPQSIRLRASSYRPAPSGNRCPPCTTAPSGSRRHGSSDHRTGERLLPADVAATTRLYEAAMSEFATHPSARW